MMSSGIDELTAEVRPATRARAITQYWDDKKVIDTLPTKPNRLHRRIQTTPHAYYGALATPKKHRRVPSLPKSNKKLISDPKKHRRILSPLQLGPKKEPAVLYRNGSFQVDEVDELIDNLKYAKQLYGDVHPKVALALNEIGNLHFRRGEFEAAKDSYVEALHRYKTTVGEEHFFVATTLGNIGTLYWRMGLYDKAKSYLDDSLRIHLTAAGHVDDNAEVASALHNLGLVCFLQENYFGAMGYLNRAFKARRNLYGKDHIDVARSIDTLGSVNLMTGDCEEAVKCHYEAFHIKHKLLGSRHPTLVATTMNIAKVHRTKGNFDEAIEIYKDALEIQKSINPNWEMIEDVGVTVHTIGFTLMMKKAYKEAMEAFVETSSIYEAAGLKDDDKRVVALKDSMAKVKHHVSGSMSLRKYVR